jgi:hypothetical protein
MREVNTKMHSGVQLNKDAAAHLLGFANRTGFLFSPIFVPVL